MSPKDGFTAMSVSFEESGAMQVCAYSGCWEGTGTVLREGSFLVLIGQHLPFSTAPGDAGKSEDIAIAFDRSDGVAILKAGSFVHPLTCRQESGN